MWEDTVHRSANMGNIYIYIGMVSTDSSIGNRDASFTDKGKAVLTCRGAGAADASSSGEDDSRRSQIHQ